MTLTTPIRILLVSVALLAGCGVEDFDGPEGDPNTADDVEADPGEADQGTSVDQITASGMIDTEEAAFLTLINQYRAQHGLGALKISVALSRASQGHSTDMATHNYFAHNSQDGRTYSDRDRAAGYSYNTYTGENIAAGYADAQHAFEQWRDACDPDAAGHCTYAHRQNMLGTNYHVIGIGRANSTTSTYGWYWTTDFGGYTDAVFSYGSSSILANGGFESAPLGSATWSSVRTRGGWYTHNAARGQGTPRSGTYQMTVNDPDPGGASATQIVFGAPGVAYTLTAYSRRASGSSGQKLYVEFLDGNYARIGVTAGASSSTSTYAAASVGAVAPSGTKYVRVFLYGPGTAGTRSSFAYDGVTLTAQ